MAIRKLEDYDVWNKSMDLALDTYRLIKMLPNDERYALADQMKRAAVSIPSNIAEGQSRGSDKEFIRFLYIALGSEAELRTQFQLCLRGRFIPAEKVQPEIELCNQVGRMLSSLIRVIKVKSN